MRSGSQFRALAWLGAYAGPRIGELLALRWSGVALLSVGAEGLEPPTPSL
jgi:hypothetical protein